MLDDLEGQIERITYTNEENGFTIARVNVRGRKELVTVTGNLLAPTPGEMLFMQGEWVQHPRYGEQFKVAAHHSKIPATAYGIEKYLGSGLIKGIGPVMAERIVKRFGKKTLETIETDIEKLALIEGIGKKRVKMIQKAWEEQKDIRDVMLFLQSHDVSAGYAVRIFKRYGHRAIGVVKENPFRLATDIQGFGFVIADRIAEKIGFQKDSPARAEAGLLYALHQLSDDGHVYYPYDRLLEDCVELLQVDRDPIAEAVARLAAQDRIVIEDINESVDDYRINNKAVYLSRLHICETGIAERIKILTSTKGSIREIEAEKAVAWVQQQLDISLAKKQIEAIICALKHKAMVLTGGPGTGKTTIINGILKIFSKLNVKVLLTAPTGRAAKRMSEATDHAAMTIHRLLEYNFHQGGFQRNAKKPLDCHLLVMDESSMVDTVIMYHLLKAVPDKAVVILVGDVNQLPSVGAGSVLKDIIASGIVPVVALNEIFRQAKASRIIINAHKINNGKMPALETENGSEIPSDFYFIQQEDPEKVLRIILELTQNRIPRRFNLDPIDGIQVLSPMHKGIVGAENLNIELQNVLNPGETGIMRGGTGFRINDKVMQIRNNYDKDVYNGDVGRIKNISPDGQEAVISFDKRDVVYDLSDLDEIMLAYAVSVHKSQGSEYPAVIVPVLTQHFILLQRNLLYTAVTRGKKLVVMVGTRKALAIGINNDKTRKRYTYLGNRLSGIT